MAGAGILEHAAHAVVGVEHPTKLGGGGSWLSASLAQLLDGKKGQSRPEGIVAVAALDPHQGDPFGTNRAGEIAAQCAGPSQGDEPAVESVGKLEQIGEGKGKGLRLALDLDDAHALIVD